MAETSKDKPGEKKGEEKPKPIEPKRYAKPIRATVIRRARSA